MSSEPTTPPLAKEQEKPVATPVATDVTVVPPRVRFSILRWAVTGVIRLSYRCWTRVAAALCPEDSLGERIAESLHIPLPDRLNMSWVTDNLAVGGRVRPGDIKALALAGVTHVVDTRSEYCDDRAALAQEHITLLHLPAPDTYPLTVEQLTEGASWVQQQLQQGGRVLIHCEHGVGRSVLLTCAALVYNGMHAHDALQLVQQKRWQAAPNHRQVGRLEEFEQYCRSHAKA
ncbi:MAG: dual specificity protein phosphatase family protein [Chloroflexi bacterium]|nr:MAG: dual specificity protein phosphatase family protein [Chloroflexota bacterium]